MQQKRKTGKIFGTRRGQRFKLEKFQSYLLAWKLEERNQSQGMQVASRRRQQPWAVSQKENEKLVPQPFRTEICEQPQNLQNGA